GGVNDAGANALTLGGTIQINSGGYFSDSPNYQAASTLKYNTGGSYGIGNEWVTGTSQPGAPYNVQLSNNSSLNFDPNRSSTTLSAQGNVTIDGGSTLTLGNSIGGDLDLYGNWTNNGSFSAANRSVNFKGSGAQTATGVTSFDYASLNNAAGL